MLSSHWAVISGLRAVNNDCSFKNQTDGAAWRLPGHFIRGWLAPRIANQDYLCGYKLISEIINH